MNSDRRLIEDFLPVEAINVVAQREKIGHAGTHPRKLHLWWARRPLAAARAVIFSAQANACHPLVDQPRILLTAQSYRRPRTAGRR